MDSDLTVGTVVPAELPDWLHRVCVEADELAEKLRKLVTFLNRLNSSNDATLPLPLYDAFLLLEQERFMRWYLQVLVRRLQYHGVVDVARYNVQACLPPRVE